jgi:hypothetical protein
MGNAAETGLSAAEIRDLRDIAGTMIRAPTIPPSSTTS